MSQKTTEELSASDDPIDKAVLAERRRVLVLIKAHESRLSAVGARLVNLLNQGTDLEEEAKLPPDERASGFDWGE